MCVAGLFCALADLHGQTVEIAHEETQRVADDNAQFGTITIVDSKDILSLDGDRIIANTTLIAQNEPLSPSEFNPDPGAMQRVVRAGRGQARGLGSDRHGDISSQISCATRRAGRSSGRAGRRG